MRAGLATIALLAIALSVSGCSVDPYCLYCETSGAGLTDGGADVTGAGDGNGTQDGDDGAVGTDGEVEDGAIDGCLAEELCNRRDDDCDDEVDEGFDLTSDSEHCGACDVACEYDHARASCEDSVCAMGACGIGWFDLDEDDANGCEYHCVGTATTDAICDRRDDDCDGEVDEDIAFDTDPTNCGVCGRVCRYAHASASCAAGVCELGSCDLGYWDDNGSDLDGCEYACRQRDPAVEICNLRDDDCDGEVDEDNPEGGEGCGTDDGACEAGTTLCVDGALVCDGEVLPTAEECNGADDDCNGEIDEGNPEAGELCGSALGTCSQGRTHCEAGDLSCIGEVTPVGETCDALDNDCDGVIDNGNPDGGAPCGSDVGACEHGIETCDSGAIVCLGGIEQQSEECDGQDNDCDTLTDEDFDLDVDPANCGMCGHACDGAHAVVGCASGDCEIVICDSGWVDLDANVANGCEYECEINGAEVCNGVDDDCDGEPDEVEDLWIPEHYCNQNGVCWETPATCAGADGWTCEYYLRTGFELAETLCDGLDNDCDGETDEPFPLKGTECFEGEGECRNTGEFGCMSDHTGLECQDPVSGVLIVAGRPGNEACDNIDNDCDGFVDEPEVDDPATAWRDGVDASAIATVEVANPAGGTMRIMQYEASRPDATAATVGSANTIACSAQNVLPWTNVTWDEARDACCALNQTGTCPGAGESGWRLCAADEWQTACEGPSGTCSWSYATSSCTTSQPKVCNGLEWDCDDSAAGDQDCLFVTGSNSFASCGTDWGVAGVVRDLSGNVKEWTSTEVVAGFYETRGGSYHTMEAGRACDEDFAIVAHDRPYDYLGFRCCQD